MTTVFASGALLTLNAIGEASTPPEMATTSFTVVTETQNPSEALDQNRELMSAVLEALYAAGVERRDARTTGLSLTSQYIHKADQPPTLRGYRVRNSVLVTVRELSELGHILRVGVKAGANEVGSLSLKATNSADVEDRAREAAVKALMSKADLQAKLLGRQIKALKSLQEPDGREQNLVGEIARGGRPRRG